MFLIDDVPIIPTADKIYFERNIIGDALEWKISANKIQLTHSVDFPKKSETG